MPSKSEKCCCCERKNTRTLQPYQNKTLTLPAQSTRNDMSTQAMIQKIAEYFKTRPVEKAWLFGSFARGEERPDSDVDILVSLDRSKPVGIRFFGMWGDLERLLGKDVDLVTEGSLMPYAADSANKDKILIYERTALRQGTPNPHRRYYRHHSGACRRHDIRLPHRLQDSIRRHSLLYNDYRRSFLQTQPGICCRPSRSAMAGHIRYAPPSRAWLLSSGRTNSLVCHPA